MRLIHFFSVFLIASCALAVGHAQNIVRCVVTVDNNAVKNVIPDDFQGLSFEEPTIVPDASGHYYYDSKNQSLVNLLTLIGVKSLRFGGTTVDGNDYKITRADIDNLFSFAKAVGAKVIYSLRLRNYPGEVKSAQYDREAQDAKYIVDTYPALIDCFELGNEPNVYYSGYKQFVPDWIQLSTAVHSAAPQARFCGPGSWNSTENSWVLPFANQFGKQSNIAYINEHIYQSQAPKYRSAPGAPAEEITHQEQLARAEMLSKNDYGNYYTKLVPALEKLGLTYRIEETNSFSGGGVPNASDAYSASLWGLNYEWWWACHEAKGLNFHTGYHRANSLRLSNYSVFGSSGNGGQTPLGLAYSMLAFKIGSQGKVIGASMTKESPNFNLTAYSVLGVDNTVYVTIINQEWGTSGRNAAVRIVVPAYSVNQVTTLDLTQSNNDISFRPGTTASGSIMLGGVPIQENGTWSGNWSAPGSPTDPHTVNVTVPAASAILVKLSQKP